MFNSSFACEVDTRVGNHWSRFNTCLQRQLSKVHPTLYDSIQKIYTQRVRFESKRAELFANFKASHRGNVRKPPNCVDWVLTLEELHTYGEMDSTLVIKEWNNVAVKADQITGTKALAVRNILSIPNPDAKDALVAHVLEFQWESCAFTEDTLGSKKIWVGYAPRGASKAWNERMKVTDQSCLLMIKNVHNTFAKTPFPIRRKVSKVDLENIAMQAAVVLSLKREVQDLLPISDMILTERWVNKFADADPRVVTEVEMVLSEKQERFAVRDIPTLCTIMDAHSGLCPLPDPTKIMIEKGDLEKVLFELQMKQMEYDLQAWQVYRHKLQTYTTTAHQTKMNWHMTAYKDNQETIKHHLSNVSRLASFDNVEVETNILKFISDIEGHFQITRGQLAFEVRETPATRG